MPPTPRARISAALFVGSLISVVACYDWTVISDSSGKDGGVDNDAGTELIAVGSTCSRPGTCVKGAFCSFNDLTCGKLGGTCAKSRSASDCKTKENVCTCSGDTVASRCTAEESGDSVAAAANCELPNGMFACGYLFCPAKSFCVETPAGNAFDYRCEPFTCTANFDCSCKEALTCGASSCAKLPEGGTIVHCN